MQRLLLKEFKEEEEREGTDPPEAFELFARKRPPHPEDDDDVKEGDAMTMKTLECRSERAIM